MDLRTAIMLPISLLALATTTHAAEISVSPGASIQAAINEAIPGDIIVIAAGTYEEDLSTESDGTSTSPITLRGEGEVVITAPGEVLAVDHGYWIVEDIIFDGQYGSADTLDIDDDATDLALRRVEVRRSGRDCIDMGAPDGVSIMDSQIHHCLHYDSDDEERVDAHGITGGAVTNLVIEGTDIHTFSGDAVQIDPGRTAPGWTNIVIRDCRFWLAPLEEDTNGFLAGQVPGENAIDTKTMTDGTRAVLTIEDSSFWGFRDGIDFSNQAALLFKENVDVTVRRTRIFDSEIGVRVRGPTDTRPLGAHVRVESSLLYGLEVGIRYEDDIEQLDLYHLTFGEGIDAHLVGASAEAAMLDIRNSLFFGSELPTEATAHTSNATAEYSDFEDAVHHDYHLSPDSDAIDAGEPIDGVDADLDQDVRVEGDAPDLGAFESGHVADTGDTEDTGSTPDTGETDDPDDPDDPDGDGPDDSAPSDDTGLDTDDLPYGIGAADVVGEKGGCGCSSKTFHLRGLSMTLLLAANVLFRRRRQIL
jgi:hypothetical protein